MKKVLLLSVLLFSSLVFATDKGNTINIQQNQAQHALGGAGGNATNSGISYKYNEILQIPPVPPAAAPNINPATACDKSVVGSKGRSYPLWANSDAGQGQVVVLGLCVCYDMADEKERNSCVHNYTCETDPIYKKIHPKSCPANPEYEKNKKPAEE